MNILFRAVSRFIQNPVIRAAVNRNFHQCRTVRIISRNAAVPRIALPPQPISCGPLQRPIKRGIANSLITGIADSLNPPHFNYLSRIKYTKENDIALIEEGKKVLETIKKDLDEAGETYLIDLPSKETKDAVQSLCNRLEYPDSALLISETFQRTSKSRESTFEQFFNILTNEKPNHTSQNRFIRDIDSLQFGQFEHFIYDEGIERFNSTELTHLFWRLRQMGDYDSAVEFVNRILKTIEQNQNQSCIAFLKNEQNLNYYHQAMLKTCYCNPDHSLGISDALFKINPQSVLAHEIKGKAHYIKAKAAEHFLENPSNPIYRHHLTTCEKNLSIHVSAEELKKYMVEQNAASEKAYLFASVKSPSPDPRYAIRAAHRSLEIASFYRKHGMPFAFAENQTLDRAFLTALLAKASETENSGKLIHLRAQLESSYLLIGQTKYRSAHEFIDLTPKLEEKFLEVCQSNHNTLIIDSINSLEGLKKGLYNLEAVSRVEKMINRLHAVQPNGKELNQIPAKPIKAELQQELLNLQEKMMMGSVKDEDFKRIAKLIEK